MQQVLEQILRFVQQGIAAIFEFASTVWLWASQQIAALTQVPWQGWPLWKQVVLLLIAIATAIALLRALRELWIAGESILAGFAALVVAVVRTIPAVAIAGIIALGGIWLVNRIDLGDVRLPTLAWSNGDRPANQP